MTGVAVSQNRENVPPYIQFVVVLIVRVKVEATPLLPKVNVVPDKLTMPEVIFNVPRTITELLMIIWGKVANELLKVKLLNWVPNAFPVLDTVWAAVPFKVTVCVPSINGSALVLEFDQLPATESVKVLTLKIAVFCIERLLLTTVLAASVFVWFPIPESVRL